jgi:hypothetical protein
MSLFQWVVVIEGGVVMMAIGAIADSLQKILRMYEREDGK